MQRRTFLVLGTAFVAAGCQTATEQNAGQTGDGDLYASGNGSGIESDSLAGSSLDGSVDRASIDYVAETWGDTVYFDFDSARVRTTDEATIRGWAEWMREFGAVQVVIAGHCDERGTREYNLALGDRRANAVREVLMAFGIAPQRIATVSFGKERPMVEGHNEAAWAANRRAVLTLA